MTNGPTPAKKFDLADPPERRWLYLSGLRYDALYRQEPWLLDFLEAPSARWTLFRWRFTVVGAVVLVVSALLSPGIGWALGLALAVGGIAVVALMVWRAIPGMIAREQASFQGPPFDPKTEGLWRWRRPGR